MEHEFRLGDWLVRPHQNQIVRGGEPVRLDPRVMQVLHLSEAESYFRIAVARPARKHALLLTIARG